jgi:hypothetical protein
MRSWERAVPDGGRKREERERALTVRRLFMAARRGERNGQAAMREREKWPLYRRCHFNRWGY